MIRKTYGEIRKNEAFRQGNPATATPSRDFPAETLNISDITGVNKIIFLNHKNQSKTCVNLHQTKGEKYTLKGVIFCPINGGYLTGPCPVSATDKQKASGQSSEGFISSINRLVWFYSTLCTTPSIGVNFDTSIVFTRLEAAFF